MAFASFRPYLRSRVLSAGMFGLFAAVSVCQGISAARISDLLLGMGCSVMAIYAFLAPVLLDTPVGFSIRGILDHNRRAQVGSAGLRAGLVSIYFAMTSMGLVMKQGFDL